MKCEQYEELFTGWMNKELTPAERQELDQHLAGCPGCIEEFAAMQQVWDMMDKVKVPEPSANMRANFNMMLEDYKASEAKPNGLFDNIKNQWSQLWQWKQRWPMAYNLAIV